MDDTALGHLLTMHFFRDCGVSAVLQSSGMTLYTAVVRAVLPCTHEKMTIVRGAL